jgi:outer membrane lipoprotein SlyB
LTGEPIAASGVETKMRALIGTAVLAFAIVMATAPADAKGCIKGAVVGGIAGHAAGHHAFIGAVTGCVVGHHLAKKHQNEAPAAASGQQN